MSGAVPPLPITPSWRGTQLKHRDNFTFIFKNLAFRRKRSTRETTRAVWKVHGLAAVCRCYAEEGI